MMGYRWFSLHVVFEVDPSFCGALREDLPAKTPQKILSFGVTT
jgi:hypothetical protein